MRASGNVCHGHLSAEVWGRRAFWVCLKDRAATCLASVYKPCSAVCVNGGRIPSLYAAMVTGGLALERRGTRYAAFPRAEVPHYLLAPLSTSCT